MDPSGSISRFPRQEPLLFYQVAPQFVLTRLSAPRSRPTTFFFSGSAGNRTRASGSVAKNSTTRPQRRSSITLYNVNFTTGQYLTQSHTESKLASSRLHDITTQNKVSFSHNHENLTSNLHFSIRWQGSGFKEYHQTHHGSGTELTSGTHLANMWLLSVAVLDTEHRYKRSPILVRL
jgi:hypothetical protein